MIIPVIPIAPVEFHIDKDMRRKLAFAEDLYDVATDRARPDFARIQAVVYKAEQTLPGSGMLPGELFALAVLDQVYCALIQAYRARKQPAVIELARDSLTARMGDSGTNALLRNFAAHFPTTAVFTGAQSLEGYLNIPPAPDRLRGAGISDAIVRLLLVYADNQNPACKNLRSLFDDRALPNPHIYHTAIGELREFFRLQPDIGIGGLSLFDALELPGKLAPHSLFEQLNIVQHEWASWLPPEFAYAFGIAHDLIREDAKRGGTDFRPGKGDTPIPDFQAQLSELRRTMFGAERARLKESEADPVQFSADTDWMTRAVVIAKSVYVWLDQLSKKYHFPIHRLDQIPDDELAQLGNWGFNGLWLIGLWQRSPASKQIKNLRGNPDAVASAYSIYDYKISDDLGGASALEALRTLAQRHGIRLASDLVPNHMGIDSRWVRDYPDRFIQSELPPYPAYRFTGPNLSHDERFELQIDDGYWDQSDAAVVFRRHDRASGRTRYIYHGNDGTSFPWNDTAQLNFLNPETREAVIQLIVNVARDFPILRFDAAMTLTKKHYQRLWFPEPGGGGAIPSRALAGMTREQLDHAMPAEFWREVVDRIAAEAPNTLLIAEAFWLTEGFFVRTLGMHRVYNSAFMNMLKLEENGQYRQVIRNTVEFDARILQRYVNFMNNPDEDTAVAQFGSSDKYFGVAVMMATLPGLPMFGHGQIEGFTEKYGHEYPRAYFNETADDELIRRHEREIFPLLRQRELFAGADHFMLYDLERENGEVDDDVFIYSNRSAGRSALVIFLNRYANADGCIRRAGAIPRAAAIAHEQQRVTLAEGLGLKIADNLFYAARDQISGLEYLLSATDLREHGLPIKLHAYECRVLLDFRELRDDPDSKLQQLWTHLAGRGVPNLEREFLRMFMAPLIRAFEQLCAPEVLDSVFDQDADITAGLILERAAPLIHELARFNADPSVSEQAKTRLQSRIQFVAAQAHAGHIEREHTHVLAAWACAAFLSELRAANPGLNDTEVRQFDWLIHEAVRESLRALGLDDARANSYAQLVVICIHQQDALQTTAAIRRFSRYSDALTDPRVQDFLGCHRAQGVIWFRKEAHDRLVDFLTWITRLNRAESEGHPLEQAALLRSAAELEDLAAIAEYDFGRFLTLLSYAGSRSVRAAPPQKNVVAV